MTHEELIDKYAHLAAKHSAFVDRHDALMEELDAMFETLRLHTLFGQLPDTDFNAVCAPLHRKILTALGRDVPY